MYVCCATQEHASDRCINGENKWLTDLRTCAQPLDTPHQQYIGALNELRNADDVEQQKEFVARSLSFKAFRCFYKALSYSATKKWVEAAALLEQCLKHIQIARDHHLDRATPPEVWQRQYEASERCAHCNADIHWLGWC
jgi:hypothetical protein